MDTHGGRRSSSKPRPSVTTRQSNADAAEHRASRSSPRRSTDDRDRRRQSSSRPSVQVAQAQPRPSVSSAEKGSGRGPTAKRQTSASPRTPDSVTAMIVGDHTPSSARQTSASLTEQAGGKESASKEPRRATGGSIAIRGTQPIRAKRKKEIQADQSDDALYAAYQAERERLDASVLWKRCWFWIVLHVISVIVVLSPMPISYVDLPDNVILAWGSTLDKRIFIAIVMGPPALHNLLVIVTVFQHKAYLLGWLCVRNKEIWTATPERYKATVIHLDKCVLSLTSFFNLCVAGAVWVTIEATKDDNTFFPPRHYSVVVVLAALVISSVFLMVIHLMWSYKVPDDAEMRRTDEGDQETKQKYLRGELKLERLSRPPEMDDPAMEV